MLRIFPASHNHTVHAQASYTLDGAGGLTPSLWYATMLPGCKSAFRAKFWPDRCRESIDIDPPAGLRPAEGPISVLSR